MKKLSLFLVFILSFVVMTGCTQKASTDPAKKAILVVSFGTSYADTREVTIEATENRFKEEFADYDIVRAFTAQIIIDVLKDRDNIEVFNVEEALNDLKEKNYSSVIIQPLHVMNGAEYDELVGGTKKFVEEKAFDELKISKPLLTSVEDYKETVASLEVQLPELQDNEAVVFMGHGTHHFANSTYAAMEYTLQDLGHKNVFMGTVEGYPGLDEVMNRLKENNIEKVTLMPFMLVAGDHANNDMGGDEDDSWKTQLKKAGYEVEVYMHGLGEVKGVQDIYLKHAHETIEGKEDSE